jgi:hypothetical protein
MDTKYTETKVVPIARKEKKEIHKKSILFSSLDKKYWTSTKNRAMYEIV